MTLSAPTQMMFIIAVVIAIIAIIVLFVPTIPILGGYAFWILVLAFVILAGACLMRGA